MLSVIAAICGPDTMRMLNFQHFAACAQRQPGSDHEFIVVEQVIDSPVYGSILQLNGIECRYIQVRYPEFNRSWLFNIAAKAARGDLLMFMDADVAFGEDYFACVLSSAPETFALGWSRSVWLNQLGREQYVTGAGYWPEWEDQSVARVLEASPDPESCKGLSNVFNREFFFSELAGYNEAFSMWGGDDCEMILRAKAAARTWSVVDYCLLHLYHEDRVRGENNLAAWYTTVADPEAVSQAMKSVPLGSLSGPLGAHQGDGDADYSHTWLVTEGSDVQ